MAKTKQIVECVPNFSEGRDMGVIRQITDAVERVNGVKLLDVDPGEATNRTVVTFVGEPADVVEAAFRAVGKAAQLIDMRQQHGAHPRIGATDVLPIVPVSGITLEECAEISRQLAKRIADGLGRDLVIVKIEWDGLIPALQSGMIDAVIAGMSPTAERKLTVAFSDAYYNSDLVMVVRKDGPYASATTLADFAGAKITGQLNTFHYTVIDQIEGVQKVNAMESFPAMIVALTSGVIDGYVYERPGAVSATASNPDLTFVTFEEGKGFEIAPEDAEIAVGIRQGSELKEKINAILAGITDEERNAIMDAAVAAQPLSE